MGIGRMKIRLLRGVLLIPFGTLVCGLLWYVYTGNNMLPGDYNGRWYVLSVVSLLMCILAAILDDRA